MTDAGEGAPVQGRLTPLPPMPEADRRRLAGLLTDGALAVLGDAIAAVVVTGSQLPPGLDAAPAGDL